MFILIGLLTRSLRSLFSFLFFPNLFLHRLKTLHDTPSRGFSISSRSLDIPSNRRLVTQSSFESGAVIRIRYHSCGLLMDRPSSAFQFPFGLDARRSPVAAGHAVRCYSRYRNARASKCSSRRKRNMRVEPVYVKSALFLHPSNWSRWSRGCESFFFETSVIPFSREEQIGSIF